MTSLGDKLGLFFHTTRPIDVASRNRDRKAQTYLDQTKGYLIEGDTHKLIEGALAQVRKLRKEALNEKRTTALCHAAGLIAGLPKGDPKIDEYKTVVSNLIDATVSKIDVEMKEYQFGQRPDDQIPRSVAIDVGKSVYFLNVAREQLGKPKFQLSYGHYNPKAKEPVRLITQDNHSGLARTVSGIVGVIGLSLGLLLFYPSISGNAIGSSINNSLGTVSVISFIVAIIGFLFYAKLRR